MKTIEKKIIDTYIPYETTLRYVGRVVGVDHHKVKRCLEKNGVNIVKGRREPFTKEHRIAISNACKGRKSWAKGKKMPKGSLYKNMSAHLRFKISAVWLSQFKDIEKLKFLNKSITNRNNRYSCDVEWYKTYIQKFYYCEQFNKIYEKWLLSGKQKYFKPSIDHIIPKSRGGTNDVSNIQFLSWFENRSKNDMTQEEWDNLKKNIGHYFV